MDYLLEFDKYERRTVAVATLWHFYTAHTVGNHVTSRHFRRDAVGDTDTGSGSWHKFPLCAPTVDSFVRRAGGAVLR